MNRTGLAVGLILLFSLSIVTPMTIGYTTYSTEKFNKYDFDSYHSSERYADEKQIRRNPVPDTVTSDVSFSYKETTSPSNVLGPMESPWPMYCHDLRHTGRSPYSTSDNPMTKKWQYELTHIAIGDVVIGNNGTIYYGANGLYALTENGTLKWKYITDFLIEGAPAIDENGTIYFGIIYGSPNYLFAINPDGTTKWRYWTGNDDIFSSPAIGNDGIVYFGCGQSIRAVYPNGTLKWRFNTDHVVYSSPVIGSDGTIYCGCHDTYLYALSPNGTLRWKYKTGDWIRTAPCIGDDGTIYVVSLDSYLYAISPNGTMRWKTGVGAGTSPTILNDGKIICGYSVLYAVNPEDGSIQWSLIPPGDITGGTPCHSSEDTIYFGTDAGWFCAVSSDGIEKWGGKIGDAVESAPAIGDDGTIYVGSENGVPDGCFHAFGRGLLRVDANGPYEGNAHTSVQFTGTIFGGIPPYVYLWDFGDGTTSNEQNPNHTYVHLGNYTATFTVTDSEGNSSSDTAPVFVDYSLPTVSIVKPTNALYIANIKILPLKTPFIIGRITVEVDASQEEGLEIAQVEFFIDHIWKATVTSKPFAWTWKGFSFSTYYELVVYAIDSRGNINWASQQVSKFF